MTTYNLIIILSTIAIVSILGIIEQLNGTGLVRRMVLRRRSMYREYDYLPYDQDDFTL
jgi:hypothetical protein